MVFDIFQKLKKYYVLKKHGIPLKVWRKTMKNLPIFQYLRRDELRRLRILTSLFLYEKEFSAVQGFELDKEKQIIIAVQACLLILNLELDYYDGWTEIIIYPDTFVVDRETTDSIGLVSQKRRALSGESWSRGPVILSWNDIQLDSFQPRPGHNVIIHEFSHKLDMLNGRANGMPPLHPTMHRQQWTDALSQAYAHLVDQLLNHQTHYFNEYAATNPAEFFAVMSEYFFTAPEILHQHCPDVYHQFTLYYKQNPLR